MSDSILLDIDGAVATVTLNRPQSLNSLNLAMTAKLREVTEQLESLAHIRVVLLRGAGDHFMAGGDIKWFHAALDHPAEERRHSFERLLAEVHGSIIRLRRLDKPVVACVQGAVAGFGLSLMSACDLAIAADNSYFTLAYCHIGTSPDGGATYALPRLVGIKQAMEIALLGDRFDARRALELGLVNRVVPLSDLATETQILVDRLARGPTAAYGRTKRLINESLNHGLAEHLLAEQDSFAASSATADFAEGVSAFVAKRKPNFTGR